MPAGVLQPFPAPAWLHQHHQEVDRRNRPHALSKEYRDENEMLLTYRALARGEPVAARRGVLRRLESAAATAFGSIINGEGRTESSKPFLKRDVERGSQSDSRSRLQGGTGDVVASSLAANGGRLPRSLSPDQAHQYAVTCGSVGLHADESGYTRKRMNPNHQKDESPSWQGDSESDKQDAATCPVGVLPHDMQLQLHSADSSHRPSKSVRFGERKQEQAGD